MAVEFGTGKTICILAIVAGCFAVLWPKLFYPMLQASISTRNPIDNSQGKIVWSGLFLIALVGQRDHSTNVFKKVKMFHCLKFSAKRVLSEYEIIRVSKAVDEITSRG
jgi:hypothetical protein